jgi:hypothetical protein
VSELVLGPLVRYADASEATVWVDTDVACGVEVFVDGASHRSHTLRVKGHHLCPGARL